MKIIRVVGARPQFMQAAVLRHQLLERGHQEILVHTGQHYDKNMSQCFFEELGLPEPDYFLNVKSKSHAEQTGNMLSLIEEIILKEKPRAMIVDGDTNSTLAGAIAASKLHLDTVHVEAGLRSYNRKMPEEINRIVTDHVSSLLCAPTTQAIKNLEKEGLSDKTVLTGDLMYDCFMHYKKQSNTEILHQFKLNPQDYILCTIHRAENTNDKNIMLSIFNALNEIPQTILFPCHPRTKDYLENHYQIDVSQFKNIRLINPVGYLEMIALEQNASSIITDSGGVQREAYFAKVPSLIVRSETEWVEQVETGWSIIGNTQKESILASYSKLMQLTRIDTNIYGDGKAAYKIVRAIEERLN